MDAFLFSHFRVTNMNLINEKNSLNITAYNFHEPLEIDTTP